MSFAKLPQAATLSPKPFKISIPDEAIEELKTLLRLSKVAKPTFENVQAERNFGVKREWIVEVKRVWEGEFNWRKHESFMNSFPQFTAEIDGFKIHFVGLFSERADAVPIIFSHGWPGSFLEFLPIIDNLRNTYTPETLPYNIVVPSLPGWAFSDPPPLDRDFGVGDIADLFDKLMVGLGFGGGYVAQGGDIGSTVSRILGVRSESCKAVHFNFMVVANVPKDVDMNALSKDELAGIQRGKQFRESGVGYSIEHGTRPSTIGLVLASNPIALLAWIGEKYLEWSDENPSIDVILEAVSLYWFTDTFPSSIYSYRAKFSGEILGAAEDPKYFLKKPMGFSNFHKELLPLPESFARTTGNLVYFNKHEAGGHFAALEQPELLMNDVAEFVKRAWNN